MPIVAFSIESGHTFTYDGTGEAPVIEVTVPEGVQYEAHYEKSEVSIGTTFPVDPGTYSYVVRTIENDDYSAITRWVVFKVEAPTTKIDAPITFNNEGAYTYNGSPLTPTYTVPEGTSVSVHYEQHETFLSNDAPSKPGTYAIIVQVAEDETYNATRSWAVFRIVDNGYTAITTLMNSLDTCVDYARASEVRQMYNNLMDDTLRGMFDEEICSENQNCTMKEKLEYMEYLANQNSSNNLGESPDLLDSENATTGIIAVVVLMVCLLGGYLFINKKRKLDK